MDLVDVSDVSPALFVTGIVFIMLIGSFLSLGVLKFFQLKKRQGGVFMGLSALSFAGLIIAINTWFS
ncbi:hypothetical protein D7Z26_04225 [Cohnella endophytica]|uniref:Uncharacterized protein n=1 Tax=Cohnella endophytica TaxID=2419778 RepID=A0A494Y382_9BACL|nr:hypothetical protein [Cohnella endophytica]RKP57196.1 hypothetical protein D7Z26_04225 [Cohnella endophytica]